MAFIKELYLYPSDIRYPQDSIRPYFGDGRSLRNTVRSYYEGRTTLDTGCLLDVVFHQDKYWTINNRSLWVYQQLEEKGVCQKIKVKEVGFRWNIWRQHYSTTCDGLTVKIRDQLLIRTAERDELKDDEDLQSDVHSEDDELMIPLRVGLLTSSDLNRAIHPEITPPRVTKGNLLNQSRRVKVQIHQDLRNRTDSKDFEQQQELENEYWTRRYDDCISPILHRVNSDDNEVSTRKYEDQCLQKSCQFRDTSPFGMSFRDDDADTYSIKYSSGGHIQSPDSEYGTTSSETKRGRKRKRERTTDSKNVEYSSAQESTAYKKDRANRSYRMKSRNYRRNTVPGSYGSNSPTSNSNICTPRNCSPKQSVCGTSDLCHTQNDHRYDLYRSESQTRHHIHRQRSPSPKYHTYETESGNLGHKSSFSRNLSPQDDCCRSRSPNYTSYLLETNPNYYSRESRSSHTRHDTRRSRSSSTTYDTSTLRNSSQNNENRKSQSGNLRYDTSRSRRDSPMYDASGSRSGSPRYDASGSRSGSPRYDASGSRSGSPRYDTSGSRSGSPRYEASGSRIGSPRYGNSGSRSGSPRYDNSGSRSGSRYDTSRPRRGNPRHNISDFRSDSPKYDARGSGRGSPSYNTSGLRSDSPKYNTSRSQSGSPRCESRSSRRRDSKYDTHRSRCGSPKIKTNRLRNGFPRYKSSSSRNGSQSYGTHGQQSGSPIYNTSRQRSESPMYDTRGSPSLMYDIPRSLNRFRINDNHRYEYRSPTDYIRRSTNRSHPGDSYKNNKYNMLNNRSTAVTSSTEFSKEAEYKVDCTNPEERRHKKARYSQPNTSVRTDIGLQNNSLEEQYLRLLLLRDLEKKYVQHADNLFSKKNKNRTALDSPTAIICNSFKQLPIQASAGNPKETERPNPPLELVKNDAHFLLSQNSYLPQSPGDTNFEVSKTIMDDDHHNSFDNSSAGRNVSSCIASRKETAYYKDNNKKYSERLADSKTLNNRNTIKSESLNLVGAYATIDTEHGYFGINTVCPKPEHKSSPVEKLSPPEISKPEKSTIDSNLDRNMDRLIVPCNPANGSISDQFTTLSSRALVYGQHQRDCLGQNKSSVLTSTFPGQQISPMGTGYPSDMNANTRVTQNLEGGWNGHNLRQLDAGFNREPQNAAVQSLQASVLSWDRNYQAFQEKFTSPHGNPPCLQVSPADEGSTSECTSGSSMDISENEEITAVTNEQECSQSSSFFTDQIRNYVGNHFHSQYHCSSSGVHTFGEAFHPTTLGVTPFASASHYNSFTNNYTQVCNTIIQNNMYIQSPLFSPWDPYQLGSPYLRDPRISPINNMLMSNGSTEANMTLLNMSVTEPVINWFNLLYPSTLPSINFLSSYTVGQTINPVHILPFYSLPGIEQDQTFTTNFQAVDVIKQSADTRFLGGSTHFPDLNQQVQMNRYQILDVPSAAMSQYSVESLSCSQLVSGSSSHLVSRTRESTGLNLISLVPESPVSHELTDGTTNFPPLEIEDSGGDHPNTKDT